MKRLPLALVTAALLGASSRSVVAEDATRPSADERQNSPIVAAAPQPAEAPTRPRIVSNAIAAQLAAAVPPYRAPAPPAEVSRVELPEDQPKNKIIRLPRYIVEGTRTPKIKDREILTPKGKVELGMKLYPGLRFGSLPFFSNAGWALAMVEEDEAAERRHEMADLVSLLPAPTTEKDKEVRDLVNQSLSRDTKTWADTGGSFQQQKR